MAFLLGFSPSMLAYIPLHLFLLPSLLSAEQITQSRVVHTRLGRSFARSKNTRAFFQMLAGPDAVNSANVGLPFCSLKPIEHDTEHPGTIDNSIVELHYELPNSRKLLHEGGMGGTMTTIHCKGNMPQECSQLAQQSQQEGQGLTKLVPVANTQECPTCTCEQDTSQELDFDYNKRFWEFMKPDCSTNANLRVLHIGIALGAFVTYVHDNCEGSTNHIIDIDPRTVTLAKQFFGAKWAEDGEHIEACDKGVQTLASQIKGDGKYDYVILDTYDQNSEVPEACRDDAFAANVHSLLKEKGHLLVNLWFPEGWGKSFKEKVGARKDLGGTAYAYSASKDSASHASGEHSSLQ